MSTQEIRERSLKLATELGFPTNPHLPLLDTPTGLRSADATVDRLLGLYVCVAVSYGFPVDRAHAWLAQERITAVLSPAEVAFLNDPKSKRARVDMQFQVEALWALAWAASYHERLDFARVVDGTFVKMFPDVKAGESSSVFRSRAAMRSVDTIAAMTDLAYCLHWAVRDHELNRRPPPGKLQGPVVRYRRKALEWLLGDEPWDEVSLDT